VSLLRLVGFVISVALISPLALAAPVSRSQHHRALAANTAGWRYYRAGQLPRAELYFSDAVALDPNYVLAHYNLACVASRLRDLATSVRELRWLAASADPVAEQKRAKAAVDADLDFVSALPEVRELSNLPPFDAANALAWLRERTGHWSTEVIDRECATRSYTFAFDRNDDVAELTIREACHGGTPHEATFPAIISVASARVRVAVPQWKQWPQTADLTLAACPGLDSAPGSCFTLVVGDQTLGPFHRGLPGASPMRTARSFAATGPTMNQ
jgi:tetratricopeptide (TPR) repeat protein